jgi:hypothetical protein
VTVAQRLVDAAKQAHAELGEVTLDLHRTELRLAQLRRQLAYAVVSYDPNSDLQPDQGDQHPRD